MRLLIFKLGRAGNMTVNCDIWRSYFAVTFPFNPFPVLTGWPVDLNVLLKLELQISAPDLQRSFFLAQGWQTESSRAPPKGELCCFRSAANRDSGLEEHLTSVLTYWRKIACTLESIDIINEILTHLIEVMEWLRITTLIWEHITQTLVNKLGSVLLSYVTCETCRLLIGIHSY